VLARPPSTVYRLRKFARRHRVGLAMSAAVAVALAFVAGGALYSIAREARQRGLHILALQTEANKTLDEKQRAETARREAEAANKFMGEMLQAADPFAFWQAPQSRPKRPADTT